jgi:hypothetical protein
MLLAMPSVGVTAASHHGGRADDVRTQRRLELFRLGSDKLVYKEVKAEDLAKYAPATPPKATRSGTGSHCT